MAGQATHIKSSDLDPKTPHKRIHEGAMFEASYLDESVADDADIEVRITTAASQSAHVRITPGAGGDAIFELFEDTTFSAAGTGITPTNRRRTGTPPVAVTTIRSEPTVDSDGTALIPPSGQFLPGGTGFLTAGLSTAEFGEWILAPGTEYLARLTNKAGTNQPLGISLFFYEP